MARMPRWVGLLGPILVGIAGAALAVILEGRGEDHRAAWGWWTARVAGVLLVWSWWSSRNLLRKR